MSLFLGKMRQHINGHKELSEHKDVVKVDAGKEVLIPLFATHSTNFDVFVKAGDHVKDIEAGGAHRDRKRWKI